MQVLCAGGTTWSQVPTLLVFVSSFRVNGRSLRLNTLFSSADNFFWRWQSEPSVSSRNRIYSFPSVLLHDGSRLRSPDDERLPKPVDITTWNRHPHWGIRSKSSLCWITAVPPFNPEGMRYRQLNAAERYLSVWKITKIAIIGALEFAQCTVIFWSDFVGCSCDLENCKAFRL